MAPRLGVCTCSLLCMVTWLPLGWGQVNLYNTLDDHTVRLSALEATLTNVTQLYGAVQQDNVKLHQENAQLKQQIQNLTSQIATLGNSDAVCQALASCTTSHHNPQPAGHTATNNGVSHTTIPPTSTAVPTSPPTTPALYTDCEDAYHRGVTSNGVAMISIAGVSNPKAVYCDMTNGGWTVIQRRFDGSQNFDQNWDAYRAGFGPPDGEYWLGNDVIHRMTSHKRFTLRIEMEDWSGHKAYASYDSFKVDSESNKFRLSVGSYSGTAGDSFHYPDSYMLQHNGMAFSTPTHDNDQSFMDCAKQLTGGWWFSSCYSSNLNGRYLRNPIGHHALGEQYGTPAMTGTGIEWYPWKRHQYSLQKVEMKIK